MGRSTEIRLPHSPLPLPVVRVGLWLVCWWIATLAAWSAVEIVPQDGGGYLITSPVYTARIQPDGNLHSLRVNGVEFLDDRVPGSAGASFFVEQPVALPALTLADRKLVAVGGGFMAQYDFADALITLTLMHTTERGAAYAVVFSPQLDYVENLARAGMAAAPADFDWPDVAVTVPTGEYVELRGGTRLWGSELGRQVWEAGNLAPVRQYTLSLTMGQKPPRRPDLTQLTALTASLNAENRQAPAGKPVEISLKFENSAREPISAEMALRVEDAAGVAMLEDRKPFTCPPHQAVTMSWPLTLTAPDFYQAQGTVLLQGAAKKTALSFGYNVSAIAPPVIAPPDFAEYWNEVVRDAAGTPVTLSRVEEPARSTATVAVYRIAIEGAGLQCYGWLAVPRFPGRYPGILQLPGDRARTLPPNPTLADCGFVVMSLEPTGQAVTGALKPLIVRASTDLNDPERFGLRGVVVRDLRALTALAGVTEVDPNRLAVTGNGLGGGLSLILAALDERIQACAPDVPYYCHIELNRTRPDWPYWEVAAYLRANPGSEEAVLRTLRYFDAANFTARITCPVLISAGIDDAYARPTNVYAVYNRLAGPRAIRLYEGGHEGGGSKHWEAKIRWLIQVLGKPSPLPAEKAPAP